MANLQQEIAATNARLGYSGCAHSRLARHERRATGPLRHFASRRSRADLPDLCVWAMKGLGNPVRAPSGYPLAVCKCEPSSYARTTAARSQFWSQLSPFVGVRDRSTGRFASVNGDVRIGLDLGLRIWKAGWVQALAGSNPASSARLTKRVLETALEVEMPTISITTNTTRSAGIAATPVAEPGPRLC